MAVHETCKLLSILQLTGDPRTKYCPGPDQCSGRTCVAINANQSGLPAKKSNPDDYRLALVINSGAGFFKFPPEDP